MLQRHIRTAAIGMTAGLCPLFLLAAGNPTLSLRELTLYLPLLLTPAAAFLGERLRLRPLTLFLVALASGYLGLGVIGFSTNRGPSPEQVRALIFLLTLLGAALCLVPSAWLMPVPILAQVTGLLAVFAVLPRLMEPSWVFEAWVWRSSVPGLGWINWMAVAAMGAMAYRSAHQKDLEQGALLIGLALACLWIQDGTLLAHGQKPLLRIYTSVPILCALSFVLYGEVFLYWRRIYVDELTGVFNRRSLNERIWNLRPHYSVAMVDIDHFKRFNDTYGHEQGDTVLRFVAAHLCAPPHGVTYRYGGEEFCILFENISAPHAARILDRLREDLAKKTFHIRASKQARRHTSKKDRKLHPRPAKVSITVSIGVAEPQADRQSAEDVIKAADAALYRAKHQGRNCVRESTPTETNFVAQLYKA